MHALKYKPKAFFRLDDTTPVQDYSGYSRVASTSGTILKGVSLTHDSTYSPLFDIDSYLATTVPGIYQRGLESRDFTLSATVYLNAGSGQHQIISKLGQWDGLWIFNNVVVFSTQYVGASFAQAFTTVPLNRKLSLVGVHTKNKNSLYINGELAAEADITPEQQALQYAYAETDQNFWHGYGNGSILMNNLGFFAHALTAEEIKAMYEADNRTLGFNTAGAYGGEIIKTHDLRPAFIDTGIYTDEDWEAGDKYNVEYEDGILYAAMQDSLSLAGTWYGSFSMYKGETGIAVNSASLWWEGLNATVEVSINGNVWWPVTKGTRLSVFTADAIPTNETLYVRVTFTAGQTDAWLKNLRLRAHTGTTTTASTGRTITFTHLLVPLNDAEPNELRDDWGMALNGGTLTIGTDSSNYPKVVEVWYKRGAAVTLSANLAAADSVYTNGVVTGDRVNEWVVKHYVSAAGFTGDLTFSGNVMIGQIGLYTNTLSAGDITNIVQSYTGILKQSTTDVSPIVLTETADAYQPYSHDWEIQSA
jgi:hypothetical protein